MDNLPGKVVLKENLNKNKNIRTSMYKKVKTCLPLYNTHNRERDDESELLNKIKVGLQKGVDNLVSKTTNV